MDVRAIMVADPVVVDSSTPVDEALVIEEKCGFRHLPVVENGRLVGIVSDRDLAEAQVAAAAGGVAAPEDPSLILPRVADVMQQDVLTVSPADDVLIATQKMLQYKVGSLPVVDSGDEIIGIVTQSDLLGAFLRACEEGAGDTSVLNPPVTDRMTRNLILCRKKTPVFEAWSICESSDVRHLLVTADSGELLGIVSDRDLRRALVRADHEELRVADVMTEKVLTIRPDTTLASAARLMLEADVHSLPITAQGELAGILTVIDLLDHCLTTPEAFRSWVPDEE